MGYYAIWVWVFCQRTLKGTHGVLGYIFWEHITWTTCAHQPLMFDWDFEVDAWSKFWRWNLLKICVWTCDMTKTSYFGKLNSTLRSVVPLAMFTDIISAFNQIQGKEVWSYKITFSYYKNEICQHRQLKVRPGPMKSFLSEFRNCWDHDKAFRPCRLCSLLSFRLSALVHL